MTFLEWLYFNSTGLVTIGCVSVMYLWTKATVFFWRETPPDERNLSHLWHSNQNIMLAFGLALASLALALGSALRGIEKMPVADWVLAGVPLAMIAIMYSLYFAKVLKSRAGAFGAAGRVTFAWRLFVWSSVAWTIFSLWWLV